MKKIALFDPSIASDNLGDEIISRSSKNVVDKIFPNSFYVEYPTHLSIGLLESIKYKKNHNYDFSFVLGSNLLKSSFLGLKNQWKITYLQSFFVNKVILLGVGWWQYKNMPNFYTKQLLKKLLSRDYLHSVRDEYTKLMLNKIGIHNVINTGCPTTWELDNSEINIKKKKSVVITLTDYNKSNYDKVFIDLILKIYDEIYFWPQGFSDLDYFNELYKGNMIKILSPNLGAYLKILNKDKVDYLGTRLHAGIMALQNGVNSTIIAIDNRAQEISKDINLRIIKRENIENFSNVTEKTNIQLKTDNIRKFITQFKDVK